MIKQIFKQIWALRFSNMWLWAELFIVSVCLWYIVDYLYVTTRLYFLPLGFDISNTYRVEINSFVPESEGYNQEEEKRERKMENLLALLERIRTYPGVEVVGVSDGKDPYSLVWATGEVIVDSVNIQANNKHVTPEYFDVFKIKDKNGSIERLVESAKKSDTFIFSAELERQFLEQGVAPLNRSVDNWGTEETYAVRNITSDFRNNRFENSTSIIYRIVPLSTLFKWFDGNVPISFRVSPEADTPDFLNRFSEAMTTQLRIGNYYLLDVTSFTDVRDVFFQSKGLINDFKTRMVILIFLLINIFMGVIGPFWVRTQQRRAELGLKMALGASKRNIQWVTIGEGILLFSFVIIPAALFSYHLWELESIADYRLPLTFGRFIFTFSLVCIIIIGMIILGVYFPVKQALKVKPADVLHEE